MENLHQYNIRIYLTLTFEYGSFEYSSTYSLLRGHRGRAAAARLLVVLRRRGDRARIERLRGRRGELTGGRNLELFRSDINQVIPRYFNIKTQVGPIHVKVCVNMQFWQSPNWSQNYRGIRHTYISTGSLSVLEFCSRQLGQHLGLGKT